MLNIAETAINLKELNLALYQNKSATKYYEKLIAVPNLN